jgi:hypothetical protein
MGNKVTTYYHDLCLFLFNFSSRPAMNDVLHLDFVPVPAYTHSTIHTIYKITTKLYIYIYKNKDIPISLYHSMTEVCSKAALLRVREILASNLGKDNGYAG